jgi:hypothetical protein
MNKVFTPFNMTKTPLWFESPFSDAISLTSSLIFSSVMWMDRREELERGSDVGLAQIEK